MLENSKLVAFVATSNPEQSRKFYEETLGLSLISDDPFAIVFAVQGTMLRVQKVEEHTPVNYAVLGWDVGNIQAEVAGLTDKGATFMRYKGLEQDENGIWHAPSGAKIAWFKDPDGNTLSLTQFKQP